MGHVTWLIADKQQHCHLEGRLDSRCPTHDSTTSRIRLCCSISFHFMPFHHVAACRRVVTLPSGGRAGD